MKLTSFMSTWRRDTWRSLSLVDFEWLLAALLMGIYIEGGRGTAGGVADMLIDMNNKGGASDKGFWPQKLIHPTLRGRVVFA
jgi:hypothetical protein